MLSHYIIVRKDLPSGLIAANIIHAAGESSPGNLPKETRAVALTAEDESHLLELENKLKSAEIDFRDIREEGQLFALGLLPVSDIAKIRKVTSNLPLLR